MADEPNLEKGIAFSQKQGQERLIDPNEVWDAVEDLGRANVRLGKRLVRAEDPEEKMEEQKKYDAMVTSVQSKIDSLREQKGQGALEEIGKYVGKLGDLGITIEPKETPPSS